jgi:streptogramin lyase
LVVNVHQALHEGRSQRPDQPYLSIQEVAELTEEVLRAMPEEDIRIPEYTSTNRQRGDIADTPLFPNLAAITSKTPQERNSSGKAPYTSSAPQAVHLSLPNRRQKRDRKVIWAIAGLSALLVFASIFLVINSNLNHSFGLIQQTATRTLTTTSNPNSSTGIIHEFQIPTNGSNPTSITRGPDNNLWFVEKTGNKIGRITPQGHITEISIPTQNSITTSITRGSDGNLWFFENGGNKIGRITPQGRITEFPLTAGSNLVGITSGPDGGIWFTEFNTNSIGRMTTSGVVTGMFQIPTPNSGSESMSAGPDGNVWFVEYRSNKIGRITPQGHITEFSIPTAVPGKENDDAITAGPDGNVWFTEFWTDKIGRITPQGRITEFPLTAGSQPSSITAGPDGNIWFTDNANQIVRMSTKGVILGVFTIPTAGSQPAACVAGPDKNIWFVEYSGNKVGKITTGL